MDELCPFTGFWRALEHGSMAAHVVGQSLLFVGTSSCNESSLKASYRFQQPAILRLRKNLVAKRVNVGRVFCLQEVGSLSQDQNAQETHPPSAEVLWRALKLPIYSVALVPLSVGSAAAYLVSGAFDTGRYLLLLFSSVLVVAWLNLSNDAYDAETGVDANKIESIVNITGSQRGVLLAAYACLALGSAGLIRAAFAVSDFRVAILLAAAISCGYVYQCPPFRLSYKGLGEPLCFLAFGPLATTAFYLCYAHERTLPVNSTVLGASLIVGLTTALILFCSHFHQIEGDKSVGKISPLVRLGIQKGSELVQIAVTCLYTGVGALAALKALPASCAWLCLLTYPIGKLVMDFIAANHQDTERIFLAKYYCVRLHIAFNMALVLGLLLHAWMPIDRVKMLLAAILQ